MDQLITLSLLGIRRATGSRNGYILAGRERRKVWKVSDNL